MQDKIQTVPKQNIITLNGQTYDFNEILDDYETMKNKLFELNQMLNYYDVFLHSHGLTKDFIEWREEQREKYEERRIKEHAIRLLKEKQRQEEEMKFKRSGAATKEEYQEQINRMEAIREIMRNKRRNQIHDN